MLRKGGRGQRRQPAHELARQEAQLDRLREGPEAAPAESFTRAAKALKAFRNFLLPQSLHERAVLRPGISRNSLVRPQRSQTYSKMGMCVPLRRRNP
jgi:hypothetical protein